MIATHVIDSRPQLGRSTNHVLLLLAAAAMMFVIHAIAWPLSLGRTGSFQLLAYFELGNLHPAYPALIGYPPVAPLFFGSLLTFAGGIGVELALGVAFIATMYWWYRAGSVWSQPIGYTLAALLIVHSMFGSQFHRIDTDGLFAVTFAAWVSYSMRNAGADTIGTYVVHGLFVALMILIRPSNQLFLIFVFYPLLFSRIPVAQRVRNAAVFALIVAGVVFASAARNKLLYGDSGSRFSNAAPLYGLMMNTRMVAPNNGPASAALADAARKHLLDQEPYKSANVDIRRLFAEGGGRAWEDLVWLSDTAWGWHTGYAILRKVALEAIRANPGEYILRVTSVWLHTFFLSYGFPVQWPDVAHGGDAVSVDQDRATIPHAAHSWTTATPDRRYEHGGAVPAVNQRVDMLIAATLGHRHGVPAVATALNRIGKLFVLMILAVGVGLISLPFVGIRSATRAQETMLATQFVATLLMLLVSSALQPATLEYRLPVDPLIMLMAIVGGQRLVHGRRELTAIERTAPAPRSRTSPTHTLSG